MVSYGTAMKVNVYNMQELIHHIKKNSKYLHTLQSFFKFQVYLFIFKMISSSTVAKYFILT